MLRNSLMKPFGYAQDKTSQKSRLHKLSWNSNSRS